jgi:uncharacterized membrane protein
MNSPQLEIFNFQFWIFVKMVFVILLAIYNVFALVVIKQVNYMTDTLELGFEGVLRLMARFHLIFAIAVLLVAIVIL